jgi:TRAP-type C4-dicarboxylate transport system substrate-binding protein
MASSEQPRKEQPTVKRYHLLVIFPLLVLALVSVLVSGACTSSEPTSTSSPTSTTDMSAEPTLIEWRAQSLFPEGDLSHKVQAVTIVNTINERLAGRLHIDLFLPDMLVPVPEQFDACSKGVFEMNVSAFAFDAQWIPEAMIAFQLPGSWTTLDECMAFFHDYGGLEFFRESYAQHNQYLLRHLPYGHNALQTKTRLDNLTDLKGMKIWAEPPQSYPIRDLGGQVTFMPLEDIYMALKLGTIEGVVYSVPELKTASMYEVVNYMYEPTIQDVLCINVALNLDAWNSLPADIQAEIEKIMDEINPQMANQLMAAENEGKQALIDNGGEVVTLSAEDAEELHRISRSSWDEIAAESDRSAEAVKLLRDFMAAEGIE